MNLGPGDFGCLFLGGLSGCCNGLGTAASRQERERIPLR